MTILTDLQRRALTAFFSADELRQKFYLTGGTALAAFHIEHRLSDDLDFFTHDVDLADVDSLVVSAFESAGIAVVRERSSPTFRRYRLDGSLQVDVVRDIEFRVGAPELHEGIMVDNTKNIAVNKVTALYGRLDPKDYVDLYFLMTTFGFDIMALLALARQKDAGLEPFQWTKVIADVDTINILPRMSKPLEITDLQNFFHKLRDTILDAIRP